MSSKTHWKDTLFVYYFVPVADGYTISCCFKGHGTLFWPISYILRVVLFPFYFLLFVNIFVVLAADHISKRRALLGRRAKRTKRYGQETVNQCLATTRSI